MPASLPPDHRAVPLADCLSRDFLLYHQLCPVAQRAGDGKIVVAVTADLLRSGLDDVAIAYGRGVETVAVSPDELLAHIERITNAAERTIELSRETGAEGSEVLTDVRDLANQAPVVRYVNLLVRDAYDAGASDIHLEATGTALTARFRLDGVLAPAPEAPGHLQHAIVSRIKLLANLDVSERRKPQDGRIRVRLETRDLDLRVSTVPTLHGESVVLRLLDRGGRRVHLDELGMPAEMLESFERTIRRPHGMVLVTGPTGSGKTTTLYAALHRRAPDAEKIITVEDPIEYQLEGVAQVPVHRQAGVTFASALRAILRQDPDVVMIGEMRDEETAGVGVQAAMTGHLVLATLHTNDAVGAVLRLADLGVAPYLIAATIEGVLAQRLVRRICDECRVTYAPAAEMVSAIAQRPTAAPRLSRGAGCARCRGTGFVGRVGIFEFLPVDSDLRDAITRRAGREEIERLADAAGRRKMREDAWLKVSAGITTVEEVHRVVQ